MKDFTKEVKETSNWLSQHGAVENNGMTRLLYTQEWVSAQRALKMHSKVQVYMPITMILAICLVNSRAVNIQIK